MRASQQPDDIGGRFSVLTAVGLLPIAVAGIDIDELMAGAAAMREEVIGKPFEENPSLLYAAIRNIFLRKGRMWKLQQIMSQAFTMYLNG